MKTMRSISMMVIATIFSSPFAVFAEEPKTALPLVEYEPSVVTLTGTISEEDFGKDAAPINRDRKAWILRLDTPISLKAHKDNAINVEERNVTEVQLSIDQATHPLNKETFGIVRFTVSGTLSHAHNTHHLRPIVLSVARFKAEMEEHPVTKSPSGRYLLATAPAMAKGKRVPGLELYLIDPDSKKDQRPPVVISDDFIKAPLGYKSSAAWDTGEELVAVSTGGRTWSKIFLFRLTKEELVPLQTPDPGPILEKAIPGFTKITRCYMLDPKWLDAETLQVTLSGTALLENGEYEDYSIPSTWKVSGNLTTVAK